MVDSEHIRTECCPVGLGNLTTVVWALIGDLHSVCLCTIHSSRARVLQYAHLKLQFLIPMKVDVWDVAKLTFHVAALLVAAPEGQNGPNHVFICTNLTLDLQNEVDLGYHQG